MKFPVIIVNFKAYESATGESAHQLAVALEKVALEQESEVVVAPSSLDVQLLARELKIPVFMQHVDPVDFGSKTGHLPVAAARMVGASGTLLNHAEHRIPSDVLQKTIELCRQHGLFTVVCAESPEKVREVTAYCPDAIAYEPPELIGGTISVSTAQPDVIKDVVAIAGSIPLLVGAGVKTQEDVRTSLALGAQGVLLASGVVLSPEPEKVLYNLIQGL